MISARIAGAAEPRKVGGPSKSQDQAYKCCSLQRCGGADVKPQVEVDIVTRSNETERGSQDKAFALF